MQRVLITGITGFVGSQMAAYLLEKEPRVRIFASRRWRSREDTIEFLNKLDINHRIQYVEADLLDFGSIKRLVEIAEPDVVFHFAAQSFPGASFVTPTTTLTTNIIGTLNLFEALRQVAMTPDRMPRVVNISSSEVYGMPDESEVPMTEETKFRAANPYSISKVGQDLIGQYYYKAYGLPVITTRMFSHEGWFRDKRFALSSFAYQIVCIEKALTTSAQIRVGNLKSVRTYAHVSDAIHAYYLAALMGIPGDVYNIGGDYTCTVGEALQILLKYSTVEKDKIDIIIDPNLLRPTDITLQIPSCSRFYAVTGWRPVKNIYYICEDLLNYWRSVL